jgi:hypothetical protein
MACSLQILGLMNLVRLNSILLLLIGQLLVGSGFSWAGPTQSEIRDKAVAAQASGAIVAISYNRASCVQMLAGESSLFQIRGIVLGVRKSLLGEYVGIRTDYRIEKVRLSAIKAISLSNAPPTPVIKSRKESIILENMKEAFRARREVYFDMYASQYSPIARFLLSHKVYSHGGQIEGIRPSIDGQTYIFDIMTDSADSGSFHGTVRLDEIDFDTFRVGK